MIVNSTAQTPIDHTDQTLGTTIPAKDGLLKGALRVLHTSDWHIGKRLYNQPRYDEFAAFLRWLEQAIQSLAVDVLIVAGDIFDTATPSNRAQELYYAFLGRVAKTTCQHVIITAGNHDSPSFLDAPKSILRSLNIQVISQASMLYTQGADDSDAKDHVSKNRAYDELIVLKDHTDTPIAIVLAVPYLRDRDVRFSHTLTQAGQKEQETAQGIRHHYHTLSARADQLRTSFANPDIPIIATGHLFVAGSQTSSDDDGMRPFYVGTLAHISADIFAQSIDYVALGHIHAPQKVANQAHIRYCGSPIAMGFGEVGKTKEVLIVDFVGKVPTISTLPVPQFVLLERIGGDFDDIMARLDQLMATKEPIYAEIAYTGAALRPNLAKDIRTKIEGSRLLALNIINRTQYQHTLKSAQVGENLIDLNPDQVFTRLLAQKQISDADLAPLKRAYAEVLQALHDAP